VQRGLSLGVGNIKIGPTVDQCPNARIVTAMNRIVQTDALVYIHLDTGYCNDNLFIKLFNRLFDEK
jgi:hypothetical protein